MTGTFYWMGDRGRFYAYDGNRLIEMSDINDITSWDTHYEEIPCVVTDDGFGGLKIYEAKGNNRKERRVNQKKLNRLMRGK